MSLYHCIQLSFDHDYLCTIHVQVTGYADMEKQIEEATRFGNPIKLINNLQALGQYERLGYDDRLECSDNADVAWTVNFEKDGADVLVRVEAKDALGDMIFFRKKRLWTKEIIDGQIVDIAA